MIRIGIVVIAIYWRQNTTPAIKVAPNPYNQIYPVTTQ